MTGWRVGWMVVPDVLVRPIERLQQNLSISVPSLSQIAAEAAFDGAAEMEEIKHGYQENRRILIEGLPKAGLTRFLPADGAFYLYADVSGFTSDSFDFAKQMLDQAGVAATPASTSIPSMAARSYGCPMRARPRRCARQLTGSLTGLNSREFRTAFRSASCLTKPSNPPLRRIFLSPH